MYRPTPSSLSKLRLARFATWARLWLAWWAAFLIEQCGGVAPDWLERDLRGRLDRMARFIACMIVIRAGARRPPPRRRHGGPPRVGVRAGALRALIGGRLRRALRGRTVAERLAKLRAVADAMESEVAKLLRRLARGLTRRTPILPAPQAQTCAPLRLLLSGPARDTS